MTQNESSSTASPKRNLTRMLKNNRLKHDTTFLGIAPWLNLAIIVVLLFMISHKITIATGVKLTLPQAPLSEKISDSAPKVILVQQSGSSETMIFFDDIRYMLNDPQECQNLSDAFKLSAEKHGWDTIILYASKEIPHGDIMQFVNLTRKAVDASILVATSTEK